MVLKHFIDPFMSTQSRTSIFKIPSLLSWKLANYNRSLLGTCLRHQCCVAKHLQLAQISVCKVWSPWDENRYSRR